MCVVFILSELIWVLLLLVEGRVEGAFTADGTKSIIRLRFVDVHVLIHGHVSHLNGWLISDGRSGGLRVRRKRDGSVLQHGVDL